MLFEARSTALALGAAVVLTSAASGASRPGLWTERPAEQQAAVPASLEVARAHLSAKLTLDQIRKMPQTEGYGGIKSSTGKITPPLRFKGVSVEYLCSLVGGLDAPLAVAVVARDGYEMTIPADRVRSGQFAAYDVSTGEERASRDHLQLIVAYEVDGKPLDVGADGELRLAIVGQSATLVTDGHWWVKWVTRIVLKPVVKEWSLQLTGVVQDQIDRATFDSCAAPKCHGARWVDATGREWDGVPLYLLAGRVDDGKKHEAGAFNRAVHGRGYTVTLVASDGRTLTLDAKTITEDGRLLVVHRYNGDPLKDTDWPLRLVGSALEPGRQLGRISEIRLALPSAPAPPRRKP